jgi:hypothetical protein
MSGGPGRRLTAVTRSGYATAGLYQLILAILVYASIMTYREALADEACVVCEARCVSRCRRCFQPICPRHLFTDDRVCGACEEEYLRRAPRQRPFNRGVAASIGMLAISAGIAFVAPFAGAILLAASGVVFGVARGAAATPDREGREQFLCELAAPKQLPPGD